MMKKFLSLILALATVMAMSVPAFAIDSDSEGKASGNVDVSVTLKSSYTLTIPTKASFDLTKKKADISVTVKGRIEADKTVLVSTPFVEEPFVSCGDSIIGYDASRKEIPFLQKDIINSKTENYTLTLNPSQLSIAPAGEYTGTLTFYAEIIDGE